MSGFFMQAVAAECERLVEVEAGFDRPNAIRVDRLEGDRNIRLNAMKFIGAVLTETEATVELIPEDEMSLYGAAQECANGNLSILPNLTRNALAAMLEGIYKTGHVIKTKSDIVDGVPIQFGQTHKATYRNSLKYTSDFKPMADRTHAETLNGHRIEDYIASGILKTHYLLVPSLVSDDMTEEEAAENNFFVENMTAVLQASTVENNTLSTESAFYAGRKNNRAPRHDFEAIRRLYEYFGETAEGLSTTQLIGTPLLIPKELMPNGVVDIVKILDGFTDGFFGMDQAPQDHVDFLRVCEQREKDVRSAVNEVVADLIAAVGEMEGPADAIAKLYELTKKHAMHYVVDDESIDISVFGQVSEQKILEAREHKKAGNFVAMLAAVEKATDEAIFTMCDGGITKKKKGIDSKGLESNNVEAKNLSEINQLESNEDNKSGRIRCFKCREYVDKKDVVKEDTWCCPKCNYEVDVCTGDVVNEGKAKSADAHNDADNNVIDMFKWKQKAEYAEPEQHEPVEQPIAEPNIQPASV